MNLFATCICAVLGVVAAAGSESGSASGYFYAPPQVPAPLLLSSFTSSLASPIQQQYHNQDAFGQYSYGYSEPLSSKQEVRTLDGVTRGSYSYRDADNKIQTVDYIADADGFRVSATNLPRAAPSASVELPKPVEETPEVAAARAEHLATYKAVEMSLAAQQMAAEQKTAALRLAPATKSTPVSSNSAAVLPSPVADTAEVAYAKQEFFKAYAQEIRRHQLIKEQQKLIALSPAVVLRSQPIVAAGAPLSLSYQPVVLPNTGALRFSYKIATTPERAYLPVH